MKLKTLRLTDVLSHVDSKVELAEFLTVFTGVSDSGKSAAIRGLDQCCNNSPAGIDLLRHGAKRGACSETAIAGEDGAGRPLTIVRRRGKSKNEYEVDGQALLAFGQGAPEEVRNRLLLSEHSFQRQSDGNFLLGDTGGQVARKLSATVGLAQIEAAYVAVAKVKTANDTDLRVAEADVKREGDALSAFHTLGEAVEAVDEAETLGADLARAEVERGLAGSLIASLDGLPADANDALVFASLHLRDAIRARNALDKASGESAGVSALVVAMEALPAPQGTKLQQAGHSVAALEKASAALNDACKNHNEVKHLVERLAAVPRPAAIGIAAAAVSAWLNASQFRVSIEASATSAKQLVDALEALTSDESDRIEASKNLLFLWRDASDKVEAARDSLAQINVCCAMVVGADKNCAESAAALMAVERELNLFKIENPVCPECGAEQEHWKAV